MHRLTWMLLGLLLTSTAVAQDLPPQRGRRGGAAAAEKAATDGDALPAGAVARLGAAHHAVKPAVSLAWGRLGNGLLARRPPGRVGRPRGPPVGRRHRPRGADPARPGPSGGPAGGTVWRSRR